MFSLLSFNLLSLSTFIVFIDRLSLIVEARITLLSYFSKLLIKLEMRVLENINVSVVWVDDQI
jgi:hypothetical protein